MLKTIDPATGEPVAEYPELEPAQTARALEAAAQAFAGWRARALAERAGVLARVAELLRSDVDAHARRMTVEMGKPIGQARAEAEKCAWVCEYYAEHGAEFLATEDVALDSGRGAVRYEPLGPVLAIMPWNFPYWQVFRFAAPGLMAGNTALLKHASNVQGCAAAIEELFTRAGAPEGVFRSLPISSKQVAALIESPLLRGVTLTGSDAAGREVAALAGRNLKKCVVELGGSDPFVVLEDVDVAAVAREAAQARTINSGQSCIAAKRFIVRREIARAFEDAFRDELERLVVGDPSDPETQVGPLAREDLLEELEQQVERSRKAGARVVCGGRRLERPGFWFAPTLLADVTADMPAASEETFGPVAALLVADSDEHAVELANRTRFGLGASVWSGTAGRGEALVPAMEAGTVSVNGIVKSDPRLPFGGIKDSGFGRELGRPGIREFTNVKSVSVSAPAS